MILVCGSPFDPDIRFLRARWDLNRVDYRLLNLWCREGKPVVQAGYEKGLMQGFIGCENWRLEVSELTGVFLNNNSCRLENSSNGTFGECDSEIGALLNNLPCKVANRPAAAMSDRSKPFQALQIRECGFQIPETLVTNDPAAAKRFYEEHEGNVIFKSISGTKSIVRKLSPQYLERLPLLRNGPTQFQTLIVGNDIRVHVVGDQCFATRIGCASVDYRYAWQEGIPLEMEPAVLSPEVISRCLLLCQKHGLTLAGIDLKESPLGEYYCFEVNAAPMFSFYERTTRQPISAALGEFLGQP
jgi:glutathione synthase/RimK-type ligase-like ATP-grasp enzyme